MLVDAGLDIPVASCEKRSLGAEALVQLGCDCLVMDDGFSHRALARHVDIVVLCAAAPFGNGYLLPRGSLRELPSRLARADIVWLHQRDERPIDMEAVDAVAPGVGRVVSRSIPTVPEDFMGKKVDLSGTTVLAVAGIARPLEFKASLQACGAQVLELLSFADHHAYDLQDAERVFALAKKLDAQAIVMTPKDAVRWPVGEAPMPLWRMGTQVEVIEGLALLDTAL